MIYIYDILTNFSSNIPYEFYEWNDKDEIVNIKKIKLARIDSKQLDDLVNNKCIIENDLLTKIYNSCELYNKSKNRLYNYTCLLSDGNRVIAFKLDKDGNAIGKSKLLLDEENEISILATNLEKYNIKYKIVQEIEMKKFLTRKEYDIYKYLLNEIKSSYDHREYSKLKYLYQEYFDKDNMTNKNMYLELLDSLNNVNDKHKELYNILIQTKKQV